MRVRDLIQVGDMVNYKDKLYLVVDYDFLCGGNAMRVFLIRLYYDRCPRIRLIKQIYDEEIEQLEIIK